MKKADCDSKMVTVENGFRKNISERKIHVKETGRLLRKGIPVLLSGLLLLLTGCGGRIAKVDTNTLIVDKEGIEDISVEDYSGLDVSGDDLKAYINEQIGKYQAGGSGTVTIEKLKLKDGIAKLSMRYDSIETYNAFNGTQYSLIPVSDWSYEDNQIKTLTNAEGESLDTETAKTLLSDSENRVLIVPAATDVWIDGNILAYCGASGIEGQTLHADEGAVIIFK